MVQVYAVVKFYNPFKLHIIVNGHNVYLLRKLTIKGWRYADYNGYYKSSRLVEPINWGSKFDSKEDAEKALNQIDHNDKVARDTKKKDRTWRKA